MQRVALMYAKVKTFLYRAKRFLRPMPGWKQRLTKYKNGQTTWPFASVAGRVHATGPWPPEWTPCEVVDGGLDADGQPQVKLKFFDLVSTISGLAATGEDAVACARCGIHLHVKDTTMADNLDIPLCPWCDQIV